MSTIIKIEDDFDLEKIMYSGQVFTLKKEESGKEEPLYSVFSGNHFLKIRETSSETYEVSCSREEFDSFWANYFDLNRNYSKLRASLFGKNDFLDESLKFGKGLRILRQDPWEMIVTFIISQRRSMAAIRCAVAKIVKMFGDERDDFVHFPSPETLARASSADVRACGVGYRAEYIIDAAQKVLSGEISISECEKLSDEDLFLKLCEIKGVGEKVANCIMLFGFGRTSRAPVDVWIKRVIDEAFNGKNPFPDYGDVAGIVQQYMFYWKTQHKHL